MALHTLHDGSKVIVMSAKELVRIPIWQGNRAINLAHVEKIKRSVGDNIQRLDSVYRIVECTVEDAGGNRINELYIIDGQHRAQVLKDHYNNSLCVPDFNVLVIQKKVDSELEIMNSFNTINCVNPIQWSDPNLVVNVYIAELVGIFNTKKQIYLRQGATKRPYVSIEALRKVLLANANKLHENKEEATLFSRRVYEWNAKQIREADMLAIGQTKPADGDMLLKCAKAGCMLAFDLKLSWIPHLL